MRRRHNRNHRMSPRTTVYTSIIGTRDSLRDDQVTEGAEFVAFVDRPFGSTLWSEKSAYAQFRSKRRNARAPKILAHQFIDANFSVWIDGSVGLRVPAGRLVTEWLGDFDLAVFAHPKRSCTYEEALECSTRALDLPELLIAQTKAYA